MNESTKLSALNPLLLMGGIYDYLFKERIHQIVNPQSPPFDGWNL